MRRFGVALLVSLAVPMVIAAQTMPTAGQGSEESKATVFGGFSLLRNGGNTPKGWDGQATFNFTRFLGITADIAGNYRPITFFRRFRAFRPRPIRAYTRFSLARR